MNGSIRLAALAALLASGAVLAQEPYTPAEQPAATPTPAEQMPAEQMPTERAPAATQGETTTGTKDQQWPEFSSLDADGNGSISKEEVQKQSLIASRFGEIDGDKNGSLSSDEYSKALDKSKAPNP